MSIVVKEQRDAQLRALAELGGKLTAEEDMIFSGRKYILPEGTDLDDAIRFFQEKRAEDEKEMVFSRTFNYRPWDGARATMYALKRHFGMMAQRSIQSFFGEIPPELRTIKTGVNATEQVPWGRVAIPMLPGADFYLGSTVEPEMGVLFQVHVKAPRKFRFHIEGVFELIENELRTNSLYRGQAFDGRDDPDFLDLAGVDSRKVVYSEEVLTQLDANVWSLLRHTDRMRELGLPMKRAVLFEGPYGTGKTLGAYLTAKEATANGWTFVYCRPGRDQLETVMATAQLYQPAVVFYEDIDTITDDAEKEDHVSRMLDIFDGIKAKGTEILCVLTTNHVERIHKGVLRPGRLDAIIHVGSLDASGIRRLIEASVPTEMLGEIDWDEVTAAMDDFLPAFVKEATDRAVRYSLSRSGGVGTLLETFDFVHSARGLRPQLELMEGAHEGKSPDALSVAFTDVIGQRVEETLGRTHITRGGDHFGELELVEDHR